MSGDPGGTGDTGSARPSPSSPSGRTELLVAGLAAAVVVVLVAVVGTMREAPRPPDAAPGLAPPPTAAVPVDPVVRAGWVDGVASRTGVPARVLAAYAAAEVRARTATPDCALTWVTLAGLGRVESNHGRFGDAVVGPDGRSDPPVLGVALDGTRGNREILDTDGGTVDGETVHDRAVGPLQFIPSTWALVGVDADGDGRADPQDVDDAAAAAATYLCAGPTGAFARELRRGDDWRAAVLSYNRSEAYLDRVRREVVALAASAGA